MADVNNPFAQHYLEIAALDPSQSSSNIPAAAQNPQFYVTWPILAFIVFFIFAFSYFIHRKMKDVQSLLMVFGFAFLMATIPIAMQSTKQSTQTGIQASPDTIPQNIVVQNLNSTGFEFSFQTQTPTAAAIRITAQNDSQDQPRVITNNDVSQTHLFITQNLKPDTTYYIEVLSDTTWFTHNGKPIIITTPPDR
jgi:hypothetical protein